MMLTIHGLPTNTNYQELKRLIKQECNITDFILDSLVMDDDGCKKVRIGVTDDGDGNHLMKCLNGYHYVGHMIRVVPVGKPNQQNQGNFDARGGYQPRSDYQSNFGNRPLLQEGNQPRANWGGHGPWGQTVQPQMPQTFSSQPAMNNNFSHQQQPRGFAPPGVPLQQNFGYPPKSNVPEHPITIMKDNFQGSGQFHHQPVAQGHFQGQSHVQQTAWQPQVQPVKPQVFDKPTAGGYNQMATFSDNHQPPKQGMGVDGGYKDYDKGDRRFGSHRDQSPRPAGRRLSPVGPSGRRASPPGRRMSPGSHGRRLSPSESRRSPGRRMSPSRMGGPSSGRAVSPGRRMSPTRPGGPARGGSSSLGRKISPPGRRVSPPGRRLSPSGRRLSPGTYRRSSPPHSGPGRRMSPGRRDMSPPRRMLPERRRSPSGRQSPARRSPLLDAPAGMRGYPTSFQSKKSSYEDDDRPSHLKQVRPAYEPTNKAPNQAMYSGGYRQNVLENVEYSASNSRVDPWQSNDKAAYHPSKNTDRIEKFDRGSDHMRMGEAGRKRSRSGTRDSRSPVRRERSPYKDRFRRHSPSPRSPRRSWALEKRRSPDVREAPPPPAWPGQNTPDFLRQNRQNFPDAPEKIGKKPQPNWERSPYADDKNDRHEKDSGPRPFGQSNPPHEKWKPIANASSKDMPRDSFNRDDRFPANIRDRDSHNYSSKEQLRRSSSIERMPYSDKRDYRDYPIKKENHDNELRHKKDIPPRRDDFPRIEEREPFRTNTAQLNKEIEDVYKRVAELGKKAQEYRNKETRFDDVRGDKFFDPNEEALKRVRDTRREFHTDTRFQPREEETRPRPNNEGNPPVRQRESRWSAPETSEVWRPKKPLSPAVKAKRDKAAEELTRRIMNKFKDNIREHQVSRVHDELTLSVSRILFDMFKHEDISYIELIIKFNKKYDANDEQRIFEEAMSSFSSNYRKRSAQDQPVVPVKTTKLSPDAIMTGLTPLPVPEWNTHPAQSMVNVNMAVNPIHPVPTDPGKPLAMQVPYVINPPSMVIPTHPFLYETPHRADLLSDKSGFTLYLCKDDFQPFTETQAEELKTFVVCKMFNESENANWAPDFIMKGLQSIHRYEVVAHDGTSKDWLLNLDFSDFKPFNVLVYTSEELWYERAAIWLPGHSRYRHIEPLHKLKLQNRKLEGVNVGKWKFVKKVVTTLGTRIYVDMPPSAARALESYKMMLSYELQKVTVFLKAVAVDKDAFDAGLNEPSVEIVSSMQNSAMPALSQDPNIVKIGIKGNKSTAINMARKIKDMVVYQLFQYLLRGGNSSTDFLKYGYCSPGHLGVIPENTESKRWITGLNLGKLNRQPIVVMGGDDSVVRYIKMYIMLPIEHNTVNSALACEKLKQSNQGVKGLNFAVWKNARVVDRHEGKTKLEVHMDLESIETIVKMDYELDYVDEDQDCLSVVVKSDYTRDRLEKLIAQYKAEMTDSYDVANMDIASESDDDVVCLD